MGVLLGRVAGYVMLISVHLHNFPCDFYVVNTITFDQSKYTATVGKQVKIKLKLSQPLQAQSGELTVNVSFVSEEEASPEGNKLCKK